MSVPLHAPLRSKLLQMEQMERFPPAPRSKTLWGWSVERIAPALRGGTGPLTHPPYRWVGVSRHGGGS